MNENIRIIDMVNISGSNYALCEVLENDEYKNVFYRVNNGTYEEVDEVLELITICKAIRDKQSDMVEHQKISAIIELLENS